MSKLKIYVGNFSDDEKGGTEVSAVNIKTFNSATSESQNTAALKFALRCDDGFVAKNVKLYFKNSGSYPYVRVMYSNYESYSYYTYGDSASLTYTVGSVGNKNVYIILTFYYTNVVLNKPEKSFPIEVSYDLEETATP